MKYDILFAGHICFDEIHPYQGEISFLPGSAVLCGAMAAGRTGKKIGVYTKMSAADDHILEPMRELGVDVFYEKSSKTTSAVVEHPSENVDERRLYIRESAGFLSIESFPEIDVDHVHLAGISNLEFSFDFINKVKAKGFNLSTDMQSFVRQVNTRTSEIAFGDVPNKKEIVELMDMVKLDVVEAKILTGYDDLEQAAIQFEKWGCPETIITRADGVLARIKGKTYFEKFTNKSIVGRTGRGDTTFAAYLSSRLDHEVDYSLKFASALVSIKMESPGPFAGTLEEVRERMNTK
jgi:sugar/nucleoside kinase (ribokinase family)